MAESKNHKNNIFRAILAVAALAAIFFYFQKVVMPKNLPQSFSLLVPFSPQAPTDKWDRNEDCEETSITMANAYLTGNTQVELPAGAALEAINNLKKWEQTNLGYNADTGAAATTRMAQGAFGLKVTQISDYTAEDLKSELVKKHPVLLSINARLLGNPKYQETGPFYHMIVVTGFDGDNFTVNDPGTNSGKSNVYSFTILKNAGADWNHATNKMEPDRKIALILSK